MIQNVIKTDDIWLGDLIFVLHKTKPMKTGWYRKLKEDNICNNFFYVFEKSAHPNFNANDSTLTNSRVTRGVFHLKEVTLDCKSKWGSSYEILARATGVGATLIVQNNYLIPDICNVESAKDISVTERGLYALKKLDIVQEVKVTDGLDAYLETIMRGESTYETK